MSKQPQPTPEELILAMLRDVLARQAEQMGLKPDEAAEPKIEEPIAVTPPKNIEPEIAPPALTPEIERRLSEAAFTSILRAEPADTKAEAPAVRPPFAPLSKLEDAPPATPPIFAPLADLEDTQPTPRVFVEDENARPLSRSELAFKAEFEELVARPLLATDLPQLLRVFVITLIVLVAFLNLPLVDGSALIRTLTDPKPVALSDGLLIREEAGPTVYLIEQGRRRLISSSEAFQHYGYRWGDVREVPRDFLRSIPEGAPIHILVKCADLPEIYLLEGQEKRWVREMGALEPLGYDVNRDLRWVSCARLRSMFDGLTIP